MLISQSDELMTSLYPPESNHLDGIEVLQQPNVLFVGAYKDESLMGCGAVKLITHDCRNGEIKRLFISPAYRGKGVSIGIMQYLENHLLDQEVGIARLEVGVKQPEARGLYQRLGYVERGPFGPYSPY